MITGVSLFTDCGTLLFTDYTGGLVIYSKLLEEGRFRLPSRDPEQGSVKMNWLDLVMMVEGVMDDPATRLRRLKRVNI